MNLATLLELMLAVALLAGAALAVLLYPSMERAGKIDRRLDSAMPRRRRSARESDARVRPAPASGAMGRLQDIAMSLLAFRESSLRQARSLLLRAGYADPGALTKYLLAKLLLPLAGLAIGTAGGLALGYKDESLVFVVGLFTLIGLRAPEFYLSNRVKERVEAAERGLPDAIDLLVICVESGLGIDQSLERVSREIGSNHRILAYELSLTVADLVILPDRSQAWENLIARIGFPQLRNVVSVLRQAERAGTEVGPALRVVAAELRKERMLVAKQKAAKLPVKITFPLIALLLPAMFLVILGPAGLAFADAIASFGDMSVARGLRP